MSISKSSKLKTCVHFVIKTFIYCMVVSLLVSPFILKNPCLVQAQTNTPGAIQGEITGEDGQPLANIQVLATEFPKNNLMMPLFPYFCPPWMPEEISEELVGAYSPYLYYSYYLSPPTIYQTQSQADGAFVLGDLPPGRYILWAYDSEGPGFRPSIFGFQEEPFQGFTGYQPYIGSYSSIPNYIPVRVSSGETAGPFDLVMEMGGSLSGRITDSADGTAVIGAKIIAALWEETTDIYGAFYNGTYFYAASDSNGDFMIPGLAEGKYILMVMEAEDYIIEPSYPYAYGGEPGQIEENVYAVSAGQTTSGCDMELFKGGTIFGQVTDQANGNPIPDVFVSAYNTDTYDYYSSLVKTAADGTYHIGGLDGNYILMVLNSPGFQGAYYPNTQDTDQIQKIYVEPGDLIGPKNFELAASPTPGNIRGQVVDEATGLPLSGIQVDLVMAYFPVSATYGYTSSYAAPGSSVYAYSESWEPPPPPLDYPGPVFTDEEGRFAFTVYESNEYGYRLYTTDPEGIYLSSAYPKEGELTELDGGIYQETYIELSEGQVIDDIQISLGKSGCVEGVVLGGPDPLAGVEVKAMAVSAEAYSTVVYGGYYPYGPMQGLADITDTEGRFCICGMDEYEFVLRARDLQKRGYMLSFYVGSSGEGVPQILSVPQGGTLSGMDISMNPGFSLTGAVKDKEGNPLADIQIVATPIKLTLQDSNQVLEEEFWNDYYPYTVSSFAVTQADGTYALTGLSGGIYSITAIDPDSTYISNSTPEVPVSASSASVVPDLVLTRGGIFSGVITNIAGEPLPGIRVSAMPEYSDPTGTYPGYGTGDGSYSGPDYDTNYIQSPDYYPGYDSTPYFRLYSLDDPLYDSNSDLVYGYTADDPGYTSYDETDNGTSLIYPSPYSDYGYYPYSDYIATTKADGTYQIKGIPAGDYQLEAYDPMGEYLSAAYDAGSPSGSISIAEAEEISGLDFTLNRGGIIKGKIQDSATSNPVSGVTVRAQMEETEEYYYSASSAGNGDYTIKNLPAGSYSVYVLQYADYQPQYYSGAINLDNATLIQVELEQTYEGIDFNLAEGASISGTLRDASTGQALSEVYSEIKLFDDQEIVVRESYSGTNGNYRFKGLPPGTYSVKVTYCYGYNPDCYRAAGEEQGTCTPIVISQTGAIEGIDLLLYPKATISGRVVDEEDQNPLNQKWVMAIPVSENTQQDPVYGYGYSFYSSRYYAVTDTDGRYTIKDLDEGEYKVLFTDPWYIYAAEYYDNIPYSQPDQATIIYVNASESVTGIDFELQVGETYSGETLSSSAGTTYPLYGGYGGQAALSPGLPSNYYSFGYGGLPSGTGGYPDGQPTEVTAPEILSNANTQATAGRNYFYQVQAQDPSTEAPLTYTLKLRPEGMAIDSKLGLVSWDPTNEDAGDSIVQVAVYNNRGGMSLESFRLSVAEDLTPPGEVLDLETRKGSHKVSLSWTLPEDTDADLAGLVLYIDDGDGYYKEINLDKATTEYIVSNLRNDQHYTFRITTKDTIGNESNGTTTAATPRREQMANENWLWPLNSWLYPTAKVTVTQPSISIYNWTTLFMPVKTEPILNTLNWYYISGIDLWPWNNSYRYPGGLLNLYSLGIYDRLNITRWTSGIQGNLGGL